jgi:exopolysaccharide biosynthesis predicted pyruvyltransferase EpsI/glycosyltransferase involved in cell wall biosynthesis
MNEKVSVIIPVDNTEKDIYRCIDSVINQTHRNLQIILVDYVQASSCTEIFADLAKKDSRIQVIHRNNAGSAEAKNAGVEAITGDYVYFLNCSDFVEKTLIEHLLANMIVTSADLVLCNYNKVDEFDNLLASVKFKPELIEIREDNRLDFIVECIDTQYKSGWEVGNRLFKAELIQRNHLFFWDNCIDSTEDLGFTLNYTLHANRISYLPEVLYYYQIRKDSIRAWLPKEPNLSMAIELCKRLEEKIVTTLKSNKTMKEYPIMIYSILNEQLGKLTFYNYKKSLSEVNDKRYFYKQINRVSTKLLMISKYYGMLRGIMIALQCICLASRKLTILGVFITNMINKSNKIHETFQYNKAKIFVKKRLFLIGSEDFWNLGDHHIAISEIEYLQDILPDYAIVEITASQYFAVNRLLPFIIKKKDLVCLHGGGNIGNYYMVAEQIRRDFLNKFPKNEKVIFPQTIHYDYSEAGRVELATDQSIINKSKNLTLCLREHLSYELAKKYFNCNVILAPDIVLYSNYIKKFNYNRIGATVILRTDVEGILSQQDKQLIEKVVKQYANDAQYIDTQLIVDINVYDRKEVVEEYVSKIAKSEFVITDRLHGMVFCAITQTPCIVLPNYNHKVAGVYEWISNLDYIIMINTMSELEGAVNKVLGMEKNIHKNTINLEGFDSLTNLLKSKVR